VPAKATDFTKSLDPEVLRRALEASGTVREPPPTGAPVEGEFTLPDLDDPSSGEEPTEPGSEEDDGTSPAPDAPHDPASSPPETKGAEILLDYLLGPGREDGR